LHYLTVANQHVVEGGEELPFLERFGAREIAASASAPGSGSLLCHGDIVTAQIT
jgi:hypothetical protein